jgi:hypothetical protein
MSSNNSDSQAAIGCFGIVGLIVLIPMLIEFAKTIFPLAIVGAIGYALFLLRNYDSRTGVVTKALNKVIDGKESNTVLELPQANNHLALPEATSVIEDAKIVVLEQEILDLKSQKEREKEELKEEMERIAMKVARTKGREALETLYGDVEPTDNYNRSDEHEKIEFVRANRKKSEELEIREIRQEVNEKAFEQDVKIHYFREEAKEDRYQIRAEMNDGFMLIRDKLILVEKNVLTLEGYMKEKLSALELSFFKELESLKGVVSNLRVELKQDIGETRLHFGHEILRVDKQQMKIVDNLRSYEHKIRSFGVEMRKIQVNAERFNMRGEAMLEKAQIAHQRHKADIKVVSNEIGTSLQRIALTEEGFAMKVSSVWTRMDQVTDDNRMALKQAAIERMGTEYLRQDHQSNLSSEKVKMDAFLKEKDHLLQRIQTENSHSSNLASLNHRLHQTESNLTHSRNRHSLLQQERTVFNKLNR